MPRPRLKTTARVQPRSTPLARSLERPGIAELPFTVTVGAFWMVVVAAPRHIQLGPVTMSGALTILVAALTLCMLPAYINTASSRTDALDGKGSARPGLPWPIWGFILLLFSSFLITSFSGEANADSIQNASVYLSFVGAILFASAARSPALVLRGWGLMRSVSTVAAYLTLMMSAVGLTFLAERAMAMVGLIVLAVVIPGVPQNGFVRFAPFAAVAAMALSLSRTSTAIGLALLAFLALRRKFTRGVSAGGKRLLRALFIVVGVALSAYALVVYYTPFRDRFLVGDNALKVGDLNISTQGRARLWDLIISESSDGLIFGHGTGAGAALIAERVPGQSHPHNEYLRLFFDFGIVGLGLFVLGYAALMWRTLRSARDTDHPLHWAAFIGLLSISLIAITDNPFVYPFVMLPLGSLVGLSLALDRFESQGARFTALDRGVGRSGNPLRAQYTVAGAPAGRHGVNASGIHIAGSS